MFYRNQCNLTILIVNVVRTRGERTTVNEAFTIFVKSIDFYYQLVERCLHESLAINGDMQVVHVRHRAPSALPMSEDANSLDYVGTSCLVV